MGVPVDITGRQYGRLTAMHFVSRDEKRASKWLCSCSCGGQKVVARTALVGGATRSCGCLKADVLIGRNKANRTHGEGHGASKTVEYRAWQTMHQRVKEPAYAARGIKVCERWNSYEMFLADMGRRPPGRRISLDRIGNDKGYEPTNCRWANDRIQNRNKSTNLIVELRGERLTMKDLSERSGINYNTLYHRIVYHRWSVEKAITPVQGRN